MKQRQAYCKTKAHEKLLGLSRAPFDLRGEGSLQQNGRLLNYISTSQYFSLHYWTQRVNDEVLAGLQELADECDFVGQFKEMKAGEVMNKIVGVESESRQVLHTACRDIFVKEPCNQSATLQASVELEKLKTFLEDIDSGQIGNERGESFHTLIHVGIGGSDLGPRSIYEALKIYAQEGKEVFFISNVDPDDAAAVLNRVDLQRCLVSIVSKSGTTLETLTNETIIRESFSKKGLDPAKHFIAVTGKGSPLDDPGNYLKSFYMFDYIGGRYSSTSMVGLTTLGFSLGYDQAVQFLRGASSVDYEAEERNIRKNPALLLALLGIWNHSYLHCPTLAVLPYSQALHRFPAHLQQCDMESNGKSIDRNGQTITYKSGPVVWGEPGTNGQHAFYQLLHQGTEIVPVEFIGFKQSQFKKDVEVQKTTSQQKLLANMLAQAVAMACGQESNNPNKYFAGNRPSSMLIADRLTPEAMGALLALYEAKIVFQGFAWNINSFDQEGVQLGKVLATQFLVNIHTKEQKDKGLHQEILKITGIV